MAHSLGLLKHKEVLSVQSTSLSLFSQVKTLRTFCLLRPMKKVRFTNHTESAKYFFLGSQDWIVRMGLTPLSLLEENDVLLRIFLLYLEFIRIQKIWETRRVCPTLKYFLFGENTNLGILNFKWIRNNLLHNHKRKTFKKLFTLINHFIFHLTFSILVSLYRHFKNSCILSIDKIVCFFLF